MNNVVDGLFGGSVTIVGSTATIKTPDGVQSNVDKRALLEAIESKRMQVGKIVITYNSRDTLRLYIDKTNFVSIVYNFLFSALQ